MALLVSACGFTEPRKFITVNENADVDGSFLISSVIGQRLRQPSSGLVLVCCCQSLKFYEACGRKLGYNLTMSVSKKSLQVVEVLRDVISLSSKNASDVLDQVYDEILEKVTTLRNSGIKSISIIIDDLTFFTNLACSEKQLILFGTKLHDLATCHDDVSLIMKLGLADLHQHLINNLQDLSDVSITVERLKSGNFWDVDGKLIIKKMKHENGIQMMESERNLLYHVGDHNVKLIAPGEFGLKI
jgi:hypothetical protein